MRSKIFLIFWRDRVIRFLSIAALLFQAAAWALILIKIMPLSRESNFLSLHYNIYFGIDLIGIWYRIFVLPISGFIFVLLNSLLIYFLYNKEKFLSYFLAATNTLVSLGLAVALLLITLLNI